MLERELFGIQWRILNTAGLELNFHEFMGFLHILSKSRCAGELRESSFAEIQSEEKSLADSIDLPNILSVASGIDCKVEVLPLDLSDSAELLKREELAYVQVYN